MSLAPASVLFGESNLNARRKYRKDDDDEEGSVWTYNTVDVDEDETGADNRTNAAASDHRPPKGSLSDYLFGFMYEDEGTALTVDEQDLLYSSVIEPTTQLWNGLNATLFVALLLSAFADVVPVALVTHMSAELSASSSTGEADAAAAAAGFAPRATVAAVLGTSVGKFVNGPVGDVFGARRTSTLYSVLLSLSLVLLACSYNAKMAWWAVFLEEFFYSVQWPCSVVVLATHYRGKAGGMYEGGIYVTSLAARLGSLIGFPCCSLLLRRLHWRVVALIGAWSALVASSVTYLYLRDSPGKLDEPQNPIDETLLHKWFPDHVTRRKKFSPGVALRMAQFVVQENVLPSMKHILRSGTFWIVALAHTGASMVSTLNLYSLETDGSDDVLQQCMHGSYSYFGILVYWIRSVLRNG